MNLKQLEYFLKVVELGSFSNAATLLKVTQPGISKQVKSLEVSLGVALLNRDGRGVAPTAAGKEFYDRSSSILKELLELEADMRGLRNTPTGEITLGIPPVTGSAYIAAVAKTYRSRYPLANVRVVEGFSYQIVDWLQLGRLDMGIIYDPNYYRDISIKKLVNQSLYFIGKCESPSAPPDVIDFCAAVSKPLIMPVRPNSLSALIESVATDKSVVINQHMEIDSTFAIKELVREGEGYSIMPLAAVHEDVARGDLFAAKIVSPMISRPLAIALPKKGVMTVSAHKLIEILGELAERFVSEGMWSEG